MSIIDNYSQILADIHATAEKIRRNSSEIRLISVSKTFPAEAVQEAINGGIRVFGENKVQEAKGKIAALTGDFDFHLIGHLQSNKARDAVKLFSMIHSIDKISTAEAVAAEARKLGKVQDILFQINTSGEDSKSGALPTDAVAICRDIIQLDGLNLCGLMTIGPLSENESDIRNSFRLLRTLQSDINRELNLTLKELSMGMSGDYRIAIEEGSTMLRIGSSIFGKRDYNV